MRRFRPPMQHLSRRWQRTVWRWPVATPPIAPPSAPPVFIDRSAEVDYPTDEEIDQLLADACDPEPDA